MKAIYKEQGGPAFPQSIEHESGGVTDYFGLSVRDYFAVHASEQEVQQMLVRVPHVTKITESGGRKTEAQGLPDNANQIARYMVADAMLKAREAA